MYSSYPKELRTALTQTRIFKLIIQESDQYS